MSPTRIAIDLNVQAFCFISPEIHTPALAYLYLCN